MSDVIEVRGLNIRALYAMSVVLMPIDEEKGCQMRADAIMDATAAGYHEYSDEQDPPVPLLLADVDELSTAWISGWNMAFEYAETARCEMCRKARGDPCRIHG